MVRLAGDPFDVSIIQIYAPTAESSDEDIENFYNNLEKAKQQCKSQDVLIIQGDFNAKVGEERFENTVGPHGLGITNDRGERLREWAHCHELVITNTWFKQHPRRKYTWMHMDGVNRNQIDYIIINARFRNSVTSAKTFPGADCFSDHNPVVASIRIKLKKTRKKHEKCLKLDLSFLKNRDIQEKYKIAVKNRFDILGHLEDINDKWKIFKEAVNESALEYLPEKQKVAKQKWMSEEILEIMEKRRANKHNKEEYNRLDKVISEKCKEAKESWLDLKCQNIERAHYLNPSEIYKRIDEICYRKSQTTAGCIKAKTGELIMDKEKILDRWSEYISELYDDHRPEISFDEVLWGEPIMESEVKMAISKMKDGKALGPDGIAIEMIRALEELGINTLTHLLNDIYNTGNIPDEMKKSIFIALPKKAAATECENHRTISLMSHITKILLRIVMLRIRNKIKPEIAEEQCGFVEGKGTTNAINILRNIIERSLEHQKDLFLCFIDYTKAFDKVRHEKLLDILKQLDVDGKDIRIIGKMYWEQTAAVKIQNEISTYKPIKRGVRQGCVLSPDLFSIYSEMIRRNIVGLPVIKINGQLINNLRYADDTVLIAENEEDLKHLLDKIVEESGNMGLSLNSKKTEVMTISRNKNTPNCNITIDGTRLKQVEKFLHLGTIITSDGIFKIN